MSIKTFLLVVFLTGMLLGGDYLIKFAVGSKHTIWYLIFAGILWCSSIYGWYYTVKDHRLAIIGMLFSVLSLIGTALIGTLLFNEKLSMTEWFGFVLAIIACILLTGKM